MSNKYDDIMEIEYPFELRHPRMSITSRAGQFSPFAALTGYSDLIKEESRITYDKIYLCDDEFDALNKKLQIVKDNIDGKTKITFSYFLKDNLKDGGRYVSVTSIVKKIDELNGLVFLYNGEFIIIDNIIDIFCDDLFKNFV